MKRPHYFSARDAMLPPAPAAPVTPVTPVAPATIRELLRSLVGREVVLQVGDLLRRGRVVSVEPLILVDASGQACMVRLDAVVAVEF